jgi:hypothetical protein
MLVTIFNANNILSVTTVRKILCAVVILFVLLYAGAKDACVFAQSAETEPGKVYDEISSPSQATPDEGLPSVEPPNRRESGVKSETVEPVNESWGSAEDFGDKVDWIHSKLHNMAQTQVERVDSWFKPPPGEQRIVPELSRFRVGLYGEENIREHVDTEVKPAVDFDAEIDLPNFNRRIKLIITTSDTTAMPGKPYIEQQDKSLRAALIRQFRRNVSTAVGVRLHWTPELFAHLVWAHNWNAGSWHFYPQQKFYWETEEGIGEISTMVIDHWINRWNTRFSTSIKWSKQDRDDDHRTGREDEGFRWSEVFLLQYAKELLDESQLGRKVSGFDIARGGEIRLSAFGGFHFVDEYRAGIFYRWSLRKKWMYLFIGPEIKWRNDNSWNREWTFKFGIEMLFWGGKER